MIADLIMGLRGATGTSVLQRRQRIAARHCAALAAQGGRRRRLWALMHLAHAATLAHWTARLSEDHEGAAAWKASAERAILELSTYRSRDRLEYRIGGAP